LFALLQGGVLVPLIEQKFRRDYHHGNRDNLQLVRPIPCERLSGGIKLITKLHTTPQAVDFIAPFAFLGYQTSLQKFVF
jgi:hypothetical protein